LKVLTQWGWNYITRRQGARLITGESKPVWRQLPFGGDSREQTRVETTADKDAMIA
jgi:hypothetical protein